jgi:type IV pilus assembly protein PilW
MSIDASAVPIGNSVGNYPTFQLIGVGANSQLTSYDMLQLINAAPVAIGDSVMELHALYLTANGVGTSPCGAACIGVDPSKTAAYNPSTLLNGTTAATAALATIKAVRIGLILKSPLMEKLQGPSGALTHVAPPTLTLFSDVPDATGTPGNLTYTRTLDPTGLCSATAPLPQCELDFRYRTMEITIPLRNPMMIS